GAQWPIKIEDRSERPEKARRGLKISGNGRDGSAVVAIGQALAGNGQAERIAANLHISTFGADPARLPRRDSLTCFAADTCGSPAPARAIEREGQQQQADKP